MNCINFPTDRKWYALEIMLGAKLIDTVANNLLSIKGRIEANPKGRTPVVQVFCVVWQRRLQTT